MRARALVTAINTDAENVYVTLSARALRPDLVIVARARTEESESKLLRAGATRVVNPQRIGGQRIAAAALHPNVVEFLDVVMHDGSLEFRLEEATTSAPRPARYLPTERPTRPQPQTIVCPVIRAMLRSIRRLSM